MGWYRRKSITVGPFPPTAPAHESSAAEMRERTQRQYETGHQQRQLPCVDQCLDREARPAVQRVARQQQSDSLRLNLHGRFGYLPTESLALQTHTGGGRPPERRRNPPARRPSCPPGMGARAVRSAHGVSVERSPAAGAGCGPRRRESLPPARGRDRGDGHRRSTVSRG